MKFYTSNSTGDSGLMYLGYWINQNFGFPFRIMTADIGIDAEIEILDNTLNSNGLIIKAQIKATQTPITTNFVEYVDKNHLDYWNKLTVPVIYFKIDLVNSNIYYKIISSYDDIELTTSDNAEKWKINFDITNDLLTTASKQKWIENFAMVEYHSIYSYIETIEREVNSIPTVNISYMDNELIDNHIEILDETDIFFEKLTALQNLYPWKFGDQLKNKIEELGDLKFQKRNFLSQEKTNLNYD